MSLQIKLKTQDELGISFGDDVPEARSGQAAGDSGVKMAPVAAVAGGGPTDTQAANKKSDKDDNNNNNDAGGGGGGDPSMSEVEARLNNLRR